MHRPVLRWPGEHVTGATELARGEARNGKPGAVSKRGTAGDQADASFGLLAIDFQGVYQVHVAAANERLSMMRFALSLLSAPFAATVALVSAKVVAPQALTSWPRVPVVLFGLLAAFGGLAVLPYLRVIEASITHARTARALNNFRLLYSVRLRDDFVAAGWSPNLPVDPGYPALFAPLSWPGITALVLALLDASYITVGLIGLARARPTPVLIAVLVAAVAALLFATCYIRTNVLRRRRRPTNPFGFPFIET
jgi:hypothetical protein